MGGGKATGEAAGAAWGGLAKWGKMNKSPLLVKLLCID